MARKIILETGYTFTPGASNVGTVVIPKHVPRERLVLITNVTTNQVIYNFSDPSLKAFAYSTTSSGASNTTTITLAADTSSMLSTHKLQILVDEYAEKFEPSETYTDPVNKFRTSSPQALIDTDFEYSIQNTKWESIGLTNNKPGFYFSTVSVPNISAIAIPQNSKTVTVTTGAVAHNLTIGTPIFIQDTFFPIANGVFIIETVPTTTTFTYSAKAVNISATTAIYDSAKTLMFPGQSYLYSQIGMATPSAITYASATGLTTITTSAPHGLAIGNEIAVTGASGLSGNGVDGNWVVAQVTSPSTFTYYGPAISQTGTVVVNPTATTSTQATIGATTIVVASATNIKVGMLVSAVGIPTYTTVTSVVGTTIGLSQGTTAALSATATTFQMAVYSRPQGQTFHRSFDGGVLFSTNSLSANQTMIRQTRRYFRYQSGKGIQVSTGTILKPYASVDNITSSGTTVTVQTREQHNIIPGTSITVSGVNESGYNGTFTVSAVTASNKFTYTATPSQTYASGNYMVAVNSWAGSSNRLGAFDLQNGLFWEFDGTTLSAVRRSSIFQIGGRVSVTQGSNTVTQTSADYPTTFTRQINPGDFVVIRGQSYRVTDIISDTTLYVSQAYRGPSATNVIMSKTQDLKVPTSSFNIDKLDGTGPSGYNIDLTKMQMFYIDYSWYGAGFIRWGVRGPNGDVIYAHKLANNNVNNEAYMRSGNLPAHYESTTLPPITKLTANVGASDTTLTVADNSSFPTSGTLKITAATTTTAATIEYVNYTSKVGSTGFAGLVRAQAGAAAQTLTAAANTSSGTVASATGIQIGQRVVSITSPSPIPDNTFVTGISGTTITLSQAVTSVNPSVIFVAPGTTTGQAFNIATTPVVVVELAQPTFAPAISHWGSSVIMDGRFDDDKSLIFTYGQTTFSNILAGASKALFSIRVAPSVDSGLGANFSVREIINRMQLKLTALDISTKTAGANMLIRAYLNATPSLSTAWTNAVSNSTTLVNSSLAQIADYGTVATTVTGGEVTGGYFVATTGQTDLTTLRDLGNSILGGGTTAANAGIYPDGPDTLTIVVTNIGAAAVDVLGRLSWTEAQA
jgi:hypothetical protein